MLEKGFVLLISLVWKILRTGWKKIFRSVTPNILKTGRALLRLSQTGFRKDWKVIGTLYVGWSSTNNPRMVKMSIFYTTSLTRGPVLMQNEPTEGRSHVSNLLSKQETIPSLKHCQAGHRWSQYWFEPTDRRSLGEQILRMFFVTVEIECGSLETSPDQRYCPSPQCHQHRIKMQADFLAWRRPDRRLSSDPRQRIRARHSISCRWRYTWLFSWHRLDHCLVSTSLADVLACHDFPACLLSLWPNGILSELFVLDASTSLWVSVYCSLRFLFTVPELALKLILMSPGIMSTSIASGPRYGIPSNAQA